MITNWISKVLMSRHFPKTVSNILIDEFIQSASLPMDIPLQSASRKKTGISFIDFVPESDCKNDNKENSLMDVI